MLTNLVIKLATEAIGAVCKLVGELWWHNAQRFIMPVFYSGAVSWDSHCWWLGLTTLPMIAPLCLGYKTFGPSDGFDRGMWLFLIAVSTGLGPTLTHHESWFAFVPICIVAGIWGATTRALLNIVIAPISGIIILSHIWFIH